MSKISFQKPLLEKLGIHFIELRYFEDTLMNRVRLESYELKGKDDKELTSLPNCDSTLTFIGLIDDLFNTPSTQYILYKISKENNITIRQLSIKSNMSYPKVHTIVKQLERVEFINVDIDKSNNLGSKCCSINKNLLKIYSHS
jgi:hypothetical protein